jgi:hypothetical protein
MPSGIYDHKKSYVLTPKREKHLKTIGFKKGNNWHLNNIGKKFPSRTGIKHFAWKGDKVGYNALHTWIYRTLGKATICSNAKCKYPRKDGLNRIMTKPKRYEWANINWKYRRNTKDWIQLCPSCHRTFDLICHHENTPTSRLTSLAMKIKDLK